MVHKVRMCPKDLFIFKYEEKAMHPQEIDFKYNKEYINKKKAEEAMQSNVPTRD